MIRVFYLCFYKKCPVFLRDDFWWSRHIAFPCQLNITLVEKISLSTLKNKKDLCAGRARVMESDVVRHHHTSLFVLDLQ